MRPFESDVSSKYGAPITEKLHLARVRLNSGGYDVGGAYWGVVGEPLWCAWNTTDSIYLRARDREAAKAHIVATYAGGPQFYR
jgi:hypothetical protein